MEYLRHSLLAFFVINLKIAENERGNITREAVRILNEPEYVASIVSKNTKPFGDGTASVKIHEAVRKFFREGE